METMIQFLKARRAGLVFSILAVLSLSLVASHTPTRQPGRLDQALLALAAPVQGSLTNLWRGLSGLSGRYLALVEVERDNAALRAIIGELRGEVNRLREAEIENRRFRSLLDFRLPEAPALFPAQVIGEDASGWFRTIRIDRGRDQGVREGLAVVNVDGVVGQVTSATSRTAEALLLLDRNSSVPVLVQRSRARGVAVGDGSAMLAIRYMGLAEDASVGDEVVTSGLGDVYPKGLLVGRIAKIERPDAGLFQRIWVAPAVDFSKLEEVMVHIPSPAGPDLVAGGDPLPIP